MTIKQSVINTFNRVGIEVPETWEQEAKVTAENRFSGDSCEVYPFIAYLINWVYRTSNDYEIGINNVNVSDFDRVRYFILEADNNAYSTCID